MFISVSPTHHDNFSFQDGFGSSFWLRLRSLFRKNLVWRSLSRLVHCGADMQGDQAEKPKALIKIERSKEKRRVLRAQLEALQAETPAPPVQPAQRAQLSQAALPAQAKAKAKPRQAPKTDGKSRCRSVSPQVEWQDAMNHWQQAEVEPVVHARALANPSCRACFRLPSCRRSRQRS